MTTTTNISGASMTQDSPDRGMRADLVLANRILAEAGVVDGFGHVSARSIANPAHFVLARSMAPALVDERDLLTFDLDGNEISGDQRSPYLERFIHASIYSARPDVGAVVHSHSPSVIPFAVVRDAALRPVYHMGSFLRGDVPIYEIRDHVGTGSDLLIRDPQLGASLAACLGEDRVVLMRGHGATVVGRDVRQAVFHAIYLVRNADIQTEALRLGPVTYLSTEEAEAAATTIEGHVDRAWDLWALSVERP